MALGKLVLIICLSFGALFVIRQLLLFFRGGTPMDDLQALKAAGARIVDVRTPAEFAQGHVPGSVNIPLDQLAGRMAEIDPARPVLLCCASGGRSGMAKGLLEKAGYGQTHNAGPWTRLL
jgi:rhodanese-related sulfurtransferase